jgi:hypothetical protein
LLLAFVIGCAPVLGKRSANQHADRQAILVAAGERNFPSSRSPLVYVADARTADAVEPIARRHGATVVRSADPVWCEDKAGTGRPVAIALTVAVDSLTSARAVVNWFMLCRMTPLRESTPSAFGEGGRLEVMRRDGVWRVTRDLLRLDF